MSKRQLVLVAIDHATDVKRAMDLALSTAKAREADVHVIQVVPEGAVHVDDRTSLWTFDARGVGIGARLASMPRSADHDGVRVRSVVLRGEPEHVVPAHAQLHQATILLVEGDFGSSRYWRTSRVVDKLARQLPMPLLVLPKQQTREQGEPRLRRILTPIDFSVASAVALRTAVDVARRDGARITLLHAVQDVPHHMVVSGSEALAVIRRLSVQVEAVAKHLRHKAASFGVEDVDTEVATGVAHSAILEIAARSDADLIVMGVPHRSSLDRMLFGSTLRRVLRRASVPVLVVPVVAGAYTWPSEPVVDRMSGIWPDSAVGRVAA